MSCDKASGLKNHMEHFTVCMDPPFNVPLHSYLQKIHKLNKEIKGMYLYYFTLQKLHFGFSILLTPSVCSFSFFYNKIKGL